MVERYVRVQTADGKIYYGLLQLNRDVHVFEGPPWRTQILTDLVLAPSDYRFLAPCIPSKIVGIDHNRRITTHQVTNEESDPILFLKPPTAIVGTKSSVPYPHISQYVDAEGELAIVVGQRCKDCPPEAAEQFIWGYTIANDVTARDPKLLVHLKATGNTVPVPRRWCFKRKYLQGNRGIEKAPFDLPDFIKATGIMEMRQALQDKVTCG